MGEAIVNAAAILGGLTVIFGAAWRWVIGPALIRTIGEVVEAKNAQQLKPIMDELSFNSGKSVKDVVNLTYGRLEDHIRLHERGLR